MRTQHSILNFRNEVPAVDMSSKTEGVDYINISKNSTSAIGKRLHPVYPLEQPFSTVFGQIGNVKSAMTFISTPNYPAALLKKSSLAPHDINRIPKGEGRLDVPNYWAVVAYIVSMRVYHDQKLKRLLSKRKTNVFTMYSEGRTSILFGKKVTTTLLLNKMGRYLAIIRNICDMIDNNEFYMPQIEAFVESCKDHPDVDLFFGTPVQMSTYVEKVKESKDTDDVVDTSVLPTDALLDAEAVDAGFLDEEFDDTLPSDSTGLPDEEALDEESAALESSVDDLYVPDSMSIASDGAEFYEEDDYEYGVVDDSEPITEGPVVLDDYGLPEDGNDMGITYSDLNEMEDMLTEQSREEQIANTSAE